MNLKNLTNDQLHMQTKTSAEKERLSTIEVLWHLRENERRMLYAQRGYRDLKEYCVKELKLSEGSAWRRISAMKLLVDIPEVEAKIQSGALNLTQISMAKTHFREVKATQEERKEILLALENQSTRSTERILAEKKPESTNLKCDVMEKPLRGQRLEVTLILDEELQTKLEEIQILLGRPYSKLELFKLMTDEKLKSLKGHKNQKERKCDAQPARSDNVVKPEAAEVEAVAKSEHGTKSRYIPKSTLEKLKLRDQYCCQYKDPQTNRQCQARLHLQVEHKNPFAMGGTHDIENLITQTRYLIST